MSKTKFVSKKSRILKLIKEGKSIAEVAKVVKVKPSYVYHIRWADLNKDKAKRLKTLKVNPAWEPVRLPNLKPSKEAGEKSSRILEAAKETNKTLEFLRGLAAQPDPVNHPPHYKSGGIETIDFIEAKDLNFRLGNVVKYVVRAGKKASDPLIDLKKARWYLDREIFVREGA